MNKDFDKFNEARWRKWDHLGKQWAHDYYLKCLGLNYIEGKDSETDVDLICFENNRAAEIEVREKWFGGLYGDKNHPYKRYNGKPIWVRKEKFFITGFCDSLTFSVDGLWLAFIQGEKMPQYMKDDSMRRMIRAFKDGDESEEMRFVIPLHEIQFIHLGKALIPPPIIKTMPQPPNPFFG